MTWDLILPEHGMDAAERERWRPRIRSGAFDLGDKQYYLYGKKQARSVAQLRTFRFKLPAVPYPYIRPRVDVAGTPYPFFVIRGQHLLVSQFDVDQPVDYHGNAGDEWQRPRLTPEDFAPDRIVQIYYWTWSTPDTPPALHFASFRFDDSEPEEYWVPEKITTSAPIVVTDDIAVPWQGNKKTGEFRTQVYDEPEIDPGTGVGTGIFTLRTKLEFGTPRNLIHNPVFEDYKESQGLLYPDHWDFVGTGVLLTESPYPYHGRMVAVTAGATGFVQQEIAVTGNRVVVSAYARSANPTGASIALMGWNFIDPIYPNVIGTDGSVVGSTLDPQYTYLSKHVPVTGSDWTRVSMRLGQTDDRVCSVDSVLPTGFYRGLVKLGGTGVFWDAVHVGEDFTDLEKDFSIVSPNHMTIEYETSEDGIYVPDRRDSYPYDTASVDLNPINSPATQGFLAIIGTEEVEDLALGLGRFEDPETHYDWIHYWGTGLATDQAVGVTTGHLTAVADLGARWVEVREPGTTRAIATTGAREVLYVDAQGTGLASLSLMQTHRERVIAETSRQLAGNPYLEGVFLDVGESATTGYNNSTELWAQMVVETKRFLATGYPQRPWFGIHNGLEMFDSRLVTEVWREPLARSLNVVIIDGATRDRDLELTEPEQRRHLEAAAYQAIEYIRSRGVDATSGVQLMTLDFTADNHDVDTIAEARNWAHKRGLLSAVSPTGGTNLDLPDDRPRFFAPRGYVADMALFDGPAGTGGWAVTGWATEPTTGTNRALTIGGESLGRRHFPVARLDGPGKWSSVGNFGDELPPADLMSVRDVPMRTPSRIQILSSSPSFVGTDQKVHSIVRPYTDGPGSQKDPIGRIYPLAAAVTDNYGNPMDGMAVLAKATSGVLGYGAITGAISGWFQAYTDHGGFAYFDYAATTGVYGDTVTAELRPGSLRTSLRLDVQIS